MEVRFWAATDSGRKRSHNEDNFLVDRGLRLFVVCDGMGGHAAGEVASAAAIQTVREVIRDGLSEVTVGSGPDRAPKEESAVLELLEEAIRAASKRVWSMAEEDPSRKGMGTTCSLLMFVGARGFIAHVGDSRIYRVGREGASQVTEDHSLRNHMIRAGRLEEGEPLERANAVTRAVGVAESIDVDTFTVDPTPEDRFVLCSDGLSDYLEEPVRLTELVAAEDLEVATGECVDFANRSGGKDNTTVIVVEVREGVGIWDARRSTPRGRALRVLPHFEGLGPEEAGQVLEALERRTLDKGETLGAEGTLSEGLVVVVEGALDLIEEGESVGRIRKGDHLGERGLFGIGSRDWSLRAAESAEVVLLERDAFEELLRDDPELAAKIEWKFLRQWARKFRDFSESAFRNPSLILPPDGETVDVVDGDLAALKMATAEEVETEETRERSEPETVNLNLDDDATSLE